MGEGKIEKRNRPPVSCNPCRGRKLKCNRALPCDTCVRRGKADICQYAPNADRSKADNRKGAVADQLKRLEEMIYNLAEQKSSPTEPPQSRTDSDQQPAKATKHQRASPEDHPGFTESNHWMSIIEDIQDIRAQLSPSNVSHDSFLQSTTSSNAETSLDSIKSSPGPEADLGFRQAGLPSIDSVLKGLPSRPLCDHWIGLFFQSRFTALPLIHPGRFQEEYEAFWKDPSQASPSWIALLFAILALASGTNSIPDLSFDPSSKVPTLNDLVLRTEQCLVIGNYTAGGKYVMEALVLHLQSYYLNSKDATRDVWFAAGVIVRLAIRLGYHRDPSTQRNLAHLTPYECEMRRRLWMTIYQMDTLVSFQVGLPSMIPTESCDTWTPSHIELEFVDPNALELPMARPLTEYTSATYTIAKQPVLEMFKRIVAHTQAITPRPYDETLRLDSMLRDAYSSMPDILQAKPISRSLVEGSALVIKRMTVEFLYLKSIILLHRHHLAHGANASLSPSHQACLGAAFTLLDRLAELHQATQPGGLLYADRYILTALNVGDMVLASVVICLDLTIRVTSPICACHSGLSPQPTDSVYTLDACLEAITRAKVFWDDLGKTFAEARIASKTVETTIQRVSEYQKNESAPYAAFQKVTFDDNSVAFETPGVTDFGMLPDSLHWEFIDQWLPNPDEAMPDLAAWVLNGGIE